MKKLDMRCGLDTTWSDLQPLADPCEHNNKPLDEQ